MPKLMPDDRRAERVVRCVFGLLLFGLGIALMLRGDVGTAPWDVFHTGVADLLGVDVGPVIIATGVALLLLWIPLGERVGLGTVLNAVLIGAFVDLTYPWLVETDRLVPRLAMMLLGLVLIGVGSGFYIGAGLGPGPRDGLMTGLSRRSIAGRPISVRTARTFIEVVVLLVGIALGGAVGVGTVAFTLGIGPLVHLFLPPLTMDGPAPEVDVDPLSGDVIDPLTGEAPTPS